MPKCQTEYSKTIKIYKIKSNKCINNGPRFKTIG